MKTCKRCLKMEIKVLYQPPIVRSWDWNEKPFIPKPFEYTENKVNKDGICHKCEVEVTKLKYDMQFLK